MKHFIVVLVIFINLFSSPSYAQLSIARQWNEVLLEAIRNDYARPTVHARNLFHSSVVMYDAWAVFDDQAETYLLGKNVHSYVSSFDGFEAIGDLETNRNKAISYAMYRLLEYRFSNSPDWENTKLLMDELMLNMQYDISFTSIDYHNGSAAALGNYIASQMIVYGLMDGSNEQNQYANIFYEPINDPILPDLSGNPDISDPNRWQPIVLDVLIDQSGNVIIGGSTPFLSPEWGSVAPFSLTDEDLSIHSHDGHEYWVYMDPGSPPQIDTINGGVSSDQYKWNFSLVSAWSSHLDPTDGVHWDISPGAIGNIQNYPDSYADYPDFYDFVNGGDGSPGHAVNPVTGQPYEAQIVPRGDYARVLAEFWADGPDSETPPGHWFTLLNHVSDHPLIVKKFKGQGEIVDDLEWDIKSYFILGSAMHDAAIVAWGIKGYYDYIRPVSAIRYLADKGQSTDSNMPNYHVAGIELIPNFIELVTESDPLAGTNLENVGKIKIRSWKGPDYIDDPFRDDAGVAWILAENWWPYQRPSFVTPPFAGFISGHSTYSRTAAEVMTLLTGSKFFPGGMGEFHAPKNEFLVFEEGPSVDLVLQWATYQDASDQCSLSRIWGGIHPPADDISGRLIGIELGPKVFNIAEKYFDGTILNVSNKNSGFQTYPNPAQEYLYIRVDQSSTFKLTITDLRGVVVYSKSYDGVSLEKVDVSNLEKGVYLLSVQSERDQATTRFIKK